MLLSLIAADSSLDPAAIVQRGGYLLLFGVVFAESGLLFGFFLPGDSLLFIAGMASAGPWGRTGAQLNLWVVLTGVFVAAVAGDQIGYLFGRRVGPALFRRPESRWFRHEHVGRAQAFFDRHGPRAIVLARFVPIVRTFCPIVAGVGHMEYRRFVRFNVLGGFLWGIGIVLLGYFLGNVAVVGDHLELAILSVVGLSLVPIGVEAIRSRRAGSGSPDAP